MGRHGDHPAISMTPNINNGLASDMDRRWSSQEYSSMRNSAKIATIGSNNTRKGSFDATPVFSVNYNMGSINASLGSPRLMEPSADFSVPPTSQTSMNAFNAFTNANKSPSKDLGGNYVFPQLSASSVTNPIGANYKATRNSIPQYTPKSGSFPEHGLPQLTQEGMSFSTSPFHDHLDLSPTRLSHNSTNSIGLQQDLEVLKAGSGSPPHPQRSVFEDIWKETGLKEEDAKIMDHELDQREREMEKLLQGDDDIGPPPQTNHSSFSWTSPPNADMPSARRFSYDIAAGANFVPFASPTTNSDDLNMNRFNMNALQGVNNMNQINQLNNLNTNSMNALGMNDYNINQMHTLMNNMIYYKNQMQLPPQSHPSEQESLKSYSKPSLGMNVYQSVEPTKEQVSQATSHVSQYLGNPSPDVLNIEKRYSYLNTSNLPHLTYPSDTSYNINSYPIIACCFKNARIDVFYINPQTKKSLENLKVGDLVIVEADRGRDLGKVVKLNVSVQEARLLRYAQYMNRKAAMSRDDDFHKKPILNYPKPVLRFARPEELLTIDAKINDELRAVNVCTTKVREYNLNMTIVDAEYQWDMKKLTFYYQSEVRIDFRDLVKELFRIYKIRIWMSKQGDI